MRKKLGITGVGLGTVLVLLGVPLWTSSTASAAAIAAQDTAARADVQPAACGLPVSTPQAEQIDRKRLDTLVAEARRANSDALVVLKNGKLVGEWYFEKERGPIQTMSATKSIVSMAIGQLIDSGAIESLDQPVADYYPEWRQGRKREITIRHLLNHTSGLQNVPNAGEEIYPAPDAIQLALAAELSHDPGTHLSYNNKAVNLLGGVVERASGKPLDIFVRDALLAPLCIDQGTSWYKDEAGVPHAMAGLELDAVGLATLGQLMLDRGLWKGERLLSDEWIELSTQPSQEYAPNSGLLWWLHADSTAPGTLRAYSANGYLGQYIVVLPSERIVVVRQKRASEDHTREMSFPRFADRVGELLGEPQQGSNGDRRPVAGPR
jgi:CubicO group peptidase (beta-lactamase class C family)